MPSVFTGSHLGVQQRADHVLDALDPGVEARRLHQVPQFGARMTEIAISLRGDGGDEGRDDPLSLLFLERKSGEPFDRGIRIQN